MAAWGSIDPQQRLFILASGSPRRRELVRLFNLPWQIRVAEVDEESIDHPDPALNVVRTARLKARAVAARAPDGAIIVAADTTVALDGRMLNKPAGPDEARQMLRSLRGRVHQVHTGIVVVDTAGGDQVEEVATVDVPMRDYSEEEMEAYIDSGDPLDKAGAYAIQHPGFRPVEDFAGCYAAVMGLALCHLMRAFHRLGLELPVDIPSACQAHNGYDCPVYEGILRGS